jgi:acyl carrier protein
MTSNWEATGAIPKKIRNGFKKNKNQANKKEKQMNSRNTRNFTSLSSVTTIELVLKFEDERTGKRLTKCSWFLAI